MKRPSEDQIYSLAQLIRSSHCTVVLDWLRECQKDVHRRLEQETNAILVHQLQGEAQALRIILNQADEAVENIRKLVP